MTEKIAIIIPVHPPHFHYIYNLIKKTSKLMTFIDFVIVFSNNSDYSSFTEKDKIKEIIIPENTNTGNIISFKKLYALEQFKTIRIYDYFIICDAEIDIIPENFTQHNIINKINNIFKNKIIYAGNYTPDFIKNIIKMCCEKFIDDLDKLKEITKNYTLYYWWSDLPVYKYEHLVSFFDKVDYTDIKHEHFDNLLYINYLLLYHDFTLLNITPLLNIKWSLEGFNTNNVEDLNILKKNHYGFSFVIPWFFYNYKDYLMNEGTFLLYHFDRYFLANPGWQPR